jgi:hypothetical protein
MGYIRNETAHSISGVEGRLFAVLARDESRGTFHTQTWKASRRRGSETLTVELRFDDECGNGKNSFAITGTLRDSRVKQDGGFIAGGCMHEDIAKWFPELAPLIKWHLTSSNGPMHYVANAVFFASERDCWGLLKGESRQIRNGKTGLPCWRLQAVGGEPYAPGAYFDGAAPPDIVPTLKWLPLLKIGEGKARELDKARSVAVWPDATDEELTAPGLKERLEARLPALLAEFRTAMVDTCGFLWSSAPQEPGT